MTSQFKSYSHRIALSHTKYIYVAVHCYNYEFQVDFHSIHGEENMERLHLILA